MAPRQWRRLTQLPCSRPRTSGAELGIGLSFRALPDQNDTITGFGAVLRAPDSFGD